MPAAFLNGAVAQLGERLNGIQEVDGSIPFGSTNPFQLIGEAAGRGLAFLNNFSSCAFY